MYQDWFKVWRKITDSKVFANPHILKLWILCLKKANWTDRVIMWDGAIDKIEVKRGQFVTGRESLHAEYYKVNRGARKTSRTVWRWLKQLESWHSIVLESVHGVTLVTLCNHAVYNDTEKNVSNLLTTECPDDVQRVSSVCPDDVQRVSTEEESLDSSKNNQEPKDGKDTPSSSGDDGGIPGRSTLDDHFAAWWKACPRKVGKKTARAAWNRARGCVVIEHGLDGRQASAYLQEAIEAFAASEVAKGQYCKHPTAWLNGGHYDDDRSEWDRKEKDNGKPAAPVKRQGRVGVNTCTKEWDA